MQLRAVCRSLGVVVVTGLSSLVIAACGTSDGVDGVDLVGADENVATTSDALTGVLEVGTKLQTAAALNLRGGPSTGHAILLTMPNAATVTVLGASPSNGFYNVRYGTQAGWAHGAYLTRVSTPGTGTGTGGSTVTIQGPKVLPHVQAFANAACSAHGCPHELGTRDGHDPSAERAIDMMMSLYGQNPADGGAQGTKIAAYGVANATKFKLYYVIWQQKINTLDGRGFRTMADRGSITQNHFDHVHVSFHP